MTVKEAKEQALRLSKTQELSAIGLFAALALVLNNFRIPAPYAGFLYYEIWEIPIVVSLLIFGLRTAVAVSAIDFIALLLIFPGSLATGPLYNLVAVLSMLLGVALAHRVGLKSHKTFLTIAASATIIGMSLRVITMTLFNGVFLRFPPPLGFSYPAASIPPILAAIAFFNASVAAYTIAISYWIVRAIPRRYNVPIAYRVRGNGLVGS